MKYAGQYKILGAEYSAAVFWLGKSHTLKKKIYISLCIVLEINNL